VVDEHYENRALAFSFSYADVRKSGQAPPDFWALPLHEKTLEAEMQTSRTRLTLAAFALSILTAGCGVGSGSLLGFYVPPPTGTPAPSLEVNTTSFLPTQVGLPVSEGFQLGNVQLFLTATTTLSPITISGTNANAFSLTTNTCGASLLNGDYCGGTITFTPPAPGTYNATLNFPNNAVGFPQSVALTATVVAGPAAIDCSVSTNLCPPLSLQGDTIAPGLFHGFADPAIRSDRVGSTGFSPDGFATYMAYSWPHTMADGTQVVDLHLASRAMGGTTFTEIGPLYQSSTVTQNASTAYAPTNYTSNETIDIIPVVVPATFPTQEVWIQAHQSYLVKPGGGIYDQLNPTSYISVSAVLLTSPTSASAGTSMLALGSSSTPEARLGAAATDASINVTQSLASLDPSTKNCASFTQPALWYQNNTTLYLLVECLEPAANVDGHQHSHFLYSTLPVGSNATQWTWAYVGEIATPAQAAKLAAAEGASYTFFTSVKFSSRSYLHLIVSPASAAPASAQQPNIQYGCRALILSGLAPPSFALDPVGAPFVVSKVTESDLYTGGNEGPAGCTFDDTQVGPSIGIVMGRKYEADPVQGFYVYPITTGFVPDVYP
jgi:hypothetical protein